MPPSARHHRGQRSHHAGVAAEEAVLRQYELLGFALLDKRWRGGAGEIDLILRKATQVVFVEVKTSRTHAEAASHLSAHQQARIYRAAEAYVAQSGDLQTCDLRFDAALVDGQGQIEILENAFGLG
ncbi:YraN family protein [Epibacterium ulvae]|uniref:YraN family protein n=1 Tax=Epibacterium ulvae TaxID=1156985 RepID=UPI001BFC261A|nr:YraN family protein [Epibacterium ulvae]MBT8155029.1 YraN family protein [Epibacterium ulvae]